MSFEKSPNFLVFIFVGFFSLSFCLEDAPVLLLPFKTKGLQQMEDDEDWVEPVDDDEGWPYDPTSQVFNASEFINKWFYNGLLTETTISNKTIESYLNMGNSKLSIEKCDFKKILTPIRGDFYYKPLNSDTYTKKGDNLGNDIFKFIGDLHYKTTVEAGKKGDGLNFYFDEKDNEKGLCGNFGFNMDTTLDATNLINQLKQRNYIHAYIWTLKYLQEDDGIIVLGDKPHYYKTDTYLMSQYCEMKAIPNQSPETAWSFKIDEIRIKPKNSEENIVISDKQIDLLPDRGLIIGTDEYKNKIDELVFNDLISKGICFREETNYIDTEKEINDTYYTYYCDRKKFYGNKYTSEKSYYNSFPSLQFYIQESNMTFTLVNDHLFHEIYNRSYFLVVFKKSENANKIWKLGEPFCSHFQFTFDQEAKIVGFYNPIKPKISNEDYLKDLENKNNNNGEDSDKTTTMIVVIIPSVIGVIILVVVAYFLGKKLNEIRKKRANELKDDFEYTSSEAINDENNKEKDVLGIQKE